MSDKYTISALIEATTLTWQLCGSDLTPAAARMMLLQIRQYGGQAIMDALSAVQREVKGRPSLADVVQRLEAQDGRPGPEEAWAIGFSSWKNPDTSMVILSEIQVAMGSAWELLKAGDKVAARVAFLESYRNAVCLARKCGLAAFWMLSIGGSGLDVPEALGAAVKAGRIPLDRALGYLQHEPKNQVLLLHLAGVTEHPLLTGPATSEVGLEKLRQIQLQLANKMVISDEA